MTMDLDKLRALTIDAIGAHDERDALRRTLTTLCDAMGQAGITVAAYRETCGSDDCETCGATVPFHSCDEVLALKAKA